MRVAVSADGPTLDAKVDPRFGRCSYFVIVDTDALDARAVENASAASAQGAGIGTAQMVASEGVSAVLTGNCGPNAYQALEAAGIKVVTGVAGTVREAVEAYKAGRYQPSSQPNVASHFGMGMGGGMGRGMGGGMGRQSAVPPAPPARPEPPVDGGLMDILKELKVQLDGLRGQVDDINRRIEELHKED